LIDIEKIRSNILGSLKFITLRLIYYRLSPLQKGA
jgi:hypothetical protein